MRKGLKKLVMATLAFAILTAIPAYAAGWNQDSTGWTYQKEDGSTPKNTWEWIDGKCYYFDEGGHILLNTTTPDNCQINADGAWIVEGVVQAQNSANGGAVANEQYPLKELLSSWFKTDLDNGRTVWKWDSWYIPWDYNEEVKQVGPSQYVFNCAVKDKNPDYLNCYRDLDLSVLVELSGYSQDGLSYVDQNKKEKMVENVRDFLNSFNWQEASDYEKACNVAKWISKAKYRTEMEDDGFAYSCLVNGYASCQGYTLAANLLATCVGLKNNMWVDVSHSYPVFLVDGIWLGYEPTTQNDYFTIANIYQPSFVMDGVENLCIIGKYCEATGYEIPEDITDRFPNISWGYIRGEKAPFIHFD